MQKQTNLRNNDFEFNLKATENSVKIITGLRLH